jgi:hypothetical protein
MLIPATWLTNPHLGPGYWILWTTVLLSLLFVAGLWSADRSGQADCA